MGGSVHCEVRGQVAWVTLAHPGKFNAMSRAMWRDLKAVAGGWPRIPDLRCVVLQGADGHFCAGGDIAEYPGFRFDEAHLRDFHENDVWGALGALRACDVPLVAAIEGNCMGAGLELASCCDIRVAGAGARFGAPIARLGFPMAPREAQLVLGAVGELTAREMLLEAAVLPAVVLQQRGFLTRVVPDDQVLNESEATAGRVAALAPHTARAHKQALRALGAGALGASALAPLLPGAYGYASNAEHREGITAFLAKRPAQFSPIESDHE
jgi:enoyl-CoA hydratase/carnithine racemase